MKQDCVFCSIVAGDMPASVVYQDELVMAFLDIRPINEGHTLVIPKEHASQLADLPVETAKHMMGVAQEMAAVVYKSDVPASGLNLMLADGASAGQEVFHAHLHVLPRYEDDGFGFKLPESPSAYPSRAQLDQVAAEMRARLE